MEYQMLETYNEHVKRQFAGVPLAAIRVQQRCDQLFAISRDKVAKGPGNDRRCFERCNDTRTTSIKARLERANEYRHIARHVLTT